MKLHDFTRLWWERVLEEDRVNSWLRRLHQAEVQGGERFLQLIENWNPEGVALTVLESIADDELAHGLLVEEVLKQRGVTAPTSWPSQPERYWDAVFKGVNNLSTACAAATFGEVLALNRFRVLIEHDWTPLDVRELARTILPDEEYHAQALRQLAGIESMQFVRPFHRQGMSALGLVEVDDDE